MDKLPNRYLTKKQVLQKYEFLSESMLKNILHKDIKGFRGKVVRKIGRRIILDESALLQYIHESL